MGDLGSLASGLVGGAAFRESAKRQAEMRAEFMRNHKAAWNTIDNSREAAAKLLGVALNADADTVKTAFRAAVRAAHPDNGGAGVDMDALTKAKEVMLLTAFTENSSDNLKSACPLCHGSGMVRAGFGSLECTSCGGTGHVGG